MEAPHFFRRFGGVLGLPNPIFIVYPSADKDHRVICKVPIETKKQKLLTRPERHSNRRCHRWSALMELRPSANFRDYLRVPEVKNRSQHDLEHT